MKSEKGAPIPRLRAGSLGAAAFAFRGYNNVNLGRTPELLEHPAYGPVVASYLRESALICAETIGRPVDLEARIRERRETRDLSTYAEDVAMIVAVELAQLRLLEQFFGITLGQARFAFGYSLGEAAALVAAGVYEVHHLLPIPLALSDDSVALAGDVTMGILISRGPELDRTAVKRLCLEISHKGQGTIGVSTFLSPNSFLLLGQGETVDRFRAEMHEVLPAETYLRKHSHRWPPLHTPITWQRSLPNRSALMLQSTPGGFRTPTPPVLSGVTGELSYNDFNSRELLHRWVDHPQLLWEMVYQTFSSGIETIVHVGPDPNLIPATFKRLSDNVQAQLTGYSPGRLSKRVVSHLVRRPWLTKLLPSRTALLRAPFIEHVILEDWLLEQMPVP